MRIYSVFLSSLLGFSFIVSSLHAGPPPNVLFIAVDDMNDWVGPLDGGYPKAQTPNLDRLAGKGVVFTNAHCASPACQPSRVSTMTGVSPAKSGVIENFMKHSSVPAWRIRSAVLEKVESLPQYFRKNGYFAVGGGKVFHTLQTSKESENDPLSWDEYFPNMEQTMPKWVRPKLIPDAEAGLTPGRPLGDKNQIFGAKPLQVEDEVTADHQVVSWACSVLKEKHDKPFFIACGLYRPHTPWEVPQKYFDMYPLDEIELPYHLENDLADGFSHGREWRHQWVLENEKQWEKFVQGYLASITFADAQVGRLLDALENSAYKDNTVIVLWSDHGMHIGEKENWEKFTLYEESTRVPLMIAAPGVSEFGKRCSRPVSLLDVYPTLTELAGLPIPSHCDGESLLPLLKDVTAEHKTPAITSFRYDHSSRGPKGAGKRRKAVVGHSVRTEHWRYSVYDTGFEELYDHRSDPNEYKNLAGDPDFKSIVKKLSLWIPESVATLNR